MCQMEGFQSCLSRLSFPDIFTVLALLEDYVNKRLNKCYVFLCQNCFFLPFPLVCVGMQTLIVESLHSLINETTD